MFLLLVPNFLREDRGREFRASPRALVLVSVRRESGSPSNRSALGIIFSAFWHPCFPEAARIRLEPRGPTLPPGNTALQKRLMRGTVYGVPTLPWLVLIANCAHVLTRRPSRALRISPRASAPREASVIGRT